RLLPAAVWLILNWQCATSDLRHAHPCGQRSRPDANTNDRGRVNHLPSRPPDRRRPDPVAKVSGASMPVGTALRRSGLMKKNHSDSSTTAASTPGEGAPLPDAPPGAREARKLQGKVLRKTCPRSSHASVILGQPRRDPLALIEASNKGRVENLLPLRFTRM